MITISNLYHDYEGKRKFAIYDITFEVEKRQIFGFLGPSGAGKTTLQNLMTAILPIQKGEITYQNIPIRKIDNNFFNQIGYSFEQPNVYSKLTGYENLKYYSMFFDVPTENPYRLLEMVGLKSDANKAAWKYSKGMKQRLVFARSIVNNPKILFLDEPLAGLDPSTASIIKDIIKQKQREDTTFSVTVYAQFIIKTAN